MNWKRKTVTRIKRQTHNNGDLLAGISDVKTHVHAIFQYTSNTNVTVTGNILKTEKHHVKSV